MIKSNDMIIVRRAFLLSIAFAAPATSLAQTLDRSIVPTPGKLPVAHLPTWTKGKLSNGATLIVVEKHDLPLVAVSIAFIGGWTSYEAPDRRGLTDFATAMLSEGTVTRTPEELSDAQQLLGIAIDASISSESGSIGFTSLRDKFEPALSLAADMMLHSTFPDSALERIRARTLVQLTQAKDQPASVAANVFSRITYGDRHPYGRVVDEQSVNAIRRDDVKSFASDYYRPGRAVITVSGDVDAVAAKAAVEKALSGWAPGGTLPTFAYPKAPAPKKRTIYLVDKPDAAQSVFYFGTPGPPRSTPDYYALEMLNTLFGGLFQSRLNHEVREVKGFSYGVGSRFAYGRGPGAFRASGAIVSSKSDSALMSFMTQFNAARGEVPFTDDEVQQGRLSLTQALPAHFSTVEGTASELSKLAVQNLPDTYFRDFGKNINAVTGNDLTRVAKRYIDVDHLNMIIVGDRKSIESSLKATGIAPIEIVDVEGRPALVP